ncbi:MAG: cytochrome c3 family protein [Smithellaceae bacterium]|nr:cytochrome c3 family protein [Smithellaceae bacterium]
MDVWKKLVIYTCGILLMCATFITIVNAAGLPLKNNACAACHKDYGAIIPKTHPDVGKGAACLSCHAPDAARAEATKFSTQIHKVHQGEKTKLECSACHAL